jgi:hypothetical protein
MQAKRRGLWLAVAGAVAVAGCASMQAPQPSVKDMTFFVTSVGSGRGGDLGGLAGADAHCANLAKAAGGPDRAWRAYLSTQAATLSDASAVNARERIGTGPWQNAKGVVVARSVEDLHSPSSNLNQQTALDEKGNLVNGRAQQPNTHDMLTGAPFPDMTCGNWTKGGPDGSAMLGHHDIAGPIPKGWAISWNSTHPSLGCNMEKLRPTGGAGLYYCFAAN